MNIVPLLIVVAIFAWGVGVCTGLSAASWYVGRWANTTINPPLAFAIGAASSLVLVAVAIGAFLLWITTGIDYLHS